MSIHVAIHGDYPESEVVETISEALRDQATVAQMRREEFRRLCNQFEEKYGWNSDEFMRRFEAGSLGDDAEYFDWFAAKRGFNIWDRRYRILSEASV